VLKCVNAAQKKFHHAHPFEAAPASHSQEANETLQRETQMTKIITFAAAFALFAPVAAAILFQAAQIVA
jgi:hypothetical protein